MESDPTGRRAVVITPPSPPITEFAAVAQVVAAMFPGMMMDGVRQTDDGFAFEIEVGRHADDQWIWRLIAGVSPYELAEMFGIGEDEASEMVDHLQGELARTTI